MLPSQSAHKNGFTLIEIIATTVLLGIIAVTGGMFLTETTRGYIMTRENSEASQKLDIAIMRIERELREAIAVHSFQKTDGSITGVSFERPAGPRSIYFSGGAISVDSTQNTSSSFSGGNILIDHISEFEISPRDGNDNEWTLSDPIEDLCAFRVRMDYNHELTAQALTVNTTVLPRNNNNTGGAVVPDNYEIPDPDQCFVATAACGKLTHPLVATLRAFRDKCLLTWSGGRAFVDFYYSYGPYAARYIAERPWARDLSYLALLPLTGLALLLLWSPLGTALFFLLLHFAMQKVIPNSRRHCRPSPFNTQQGSILLVTIGALVFVGIVGSALVPMFSTAIQDQAVMNVGSRAFYIAESGYNIAAHEFLHSDDKDQALVDMHDREYTIQGGQDGTFTLEVYPQWFNIQTASPSAITAQIPGGWDSSIFTPPSRGKLAINTRVFEYTLSSTPSQRGVKPTFTFTPRSGNFGAVSQGDYITLVATANNAGVHGRSITLSSGANAFPQLNGAFYDKSSGISYTYTKRDGSTLKGVRRADDPDGNLNINWESETDLILDKFVIIRSTGHFGQAAHTLTYNTPIGWLQQTGANGAVRAEQDVNSPLAYLESAPNAPYHMGSHINNNGALEVTDTASNGWSHIAFSPSGGFNWNDIWNANGRTLTYDVQTKINIPQDKEYWMAGINFRLRHDSEGRYATYGVSFARLKTLITVSLPFFFESYSPQDGLPPFPSLRRDLRDNYEELSLVKEISWQKTLVYSPPIILLWQLRWGTNRWGQIVPKYTPIAYKVLGRDSGIIVNYHPWFYTPRFKPWSTIYTRIEEGLPYTFSPDAGSPLIRKDSQIRIKKPDGNAFTASVSGDPVPIEGNKYAILLKGFNSSEFSKDFSRYNITYTIPGESSSGSGVIKYASDRYEPTNFIRVYYGSPTSVGGASNANARDNRRSASPRRTSQNDLYKWTPTHERDVTPDSDFLTLIDWDHTFSSRWLWSFDDFNYFDNAVIDHDLYISWNGQQNAQAPQHEVGLHTKGSSSRGIQFDDFGVQAWVKGHTKGFRPPIVQSN
ncbi:type II secretion system protein [Desulfobaculum senezii]